MHLAIAEEKREEVPISFSAVSMPEQVLQNDLRQPTNIGGHVLFIQLKQATEEFLSLTLTAAPK